MAPIPPRRSNGALLIAAALAGACSGVPGALAAPARGPTLPEIRVSAATPGVPACVTPSRLMRHLVERTRDLDPRFRDIARYYKLHGDAPVYAILRDARDRAKQAGAQNIEERAIEGAPVEALIHLAQEVKADVLVVGDVGLNSVAGRLLGSVPADIARKAKIDILIVHTAD